MRLVVLPSGAGTERGFDGARMSALGDRHSDSGYRHSLASGVPVEKPASGCEFHNRENSDGCSSARAFVWKFVRSYCIATGKMVHCGVVISNIRPTSGGVMRAGQRVQLKPLPQIAEALKLGSPATGTVLCSYRLDRRALTRHELLDVRLDTQVILWGVAADIFEESAPALPQQGRVA
jgi:hypothetical protein